MSLRLFEPPLLNPEFYDLWKREIQLWRLASNISPSRQAPAVLSLTGQARTAILEMDISLLNAEDGMDKLVEKLDTLFLEDKNQSAFICYENFKNYHRECNTSINDYLIQFDRHIAKLREFQITLPEPVLAYRALKSANLSPENERLIRATINNLTLYDMAQQLKKIMRGNLTLINTSQQQSISVKKEMDIAFSRDDTHSKDDQILYGRQVYNKPTLPFHLSSSSTNNRRGPRKFNGRYSNRQTPNCYICGCKFHYSNKCPYSETNNTTTQENMVLLNEYKNDCHNETGSCEEVANIVLLNREKLDNSSLLGQTINSAILDSGASTTVCGKKWLDCFLETLPEDSKKKIPYEEGTKCFKFRDGLKVKSLKKVTLPCVIAKMNVKIISDVVDANIPLLLSKTAMKRARMTLNFNNDTAEMFGKRIKLLCTTSGHYHVPISRPPPDRGKLRHILFLNNIDKKGKVEKLKIATKLHKQFSHPSAKKLCDLVKSAGLKDVEFIDILMKLPLTCQTCIRYKKTCTPTCCRISPGDSLQPDCSYGHKGN